MSAPSAGLQQLVLAPEKQPRAMARVAIVEAAERYASAAPGRKEGLAEWCQLFNSGRIEMPQVRAFYEHVDIRSLYRWISAYREEGLAGLADKYGNRAGRGRIDMSDELQLYLLAELFEYPHLHARQYLDSISAWRPDLVDGLTEDMIRRWVERWCEKHRQLYAWITNPDRWKSEFKAAFGVADENIVALNQLWELDSTPADVMLTDGRHSIIGCIDVYSRRLKLLVSRTSKASAIAALMRRAMLDWGVPEAVRTDRGQDYHSNYLRQVLKALDIKHKLCLPFQSEGKPFIERHFRTFSHDLLEMLPGYVGHNVTQRKDIESRKSFAERLMGKGDIIPIELSADELQTFCDRWITDRYEHAEHRGLNGSTPSAVAQAWLASNSVRRIPDDQVRALDVLLSENAGWRTVTKKGLRLDNAVYDHHLLGPLIGQRVRVFLDEADLGRVIVYDEEDRFVCIATAPHLQEIGRREAAALVHRTTKEALQRETAELKARVRVVQKELAGRSLVDVIFDRRREKLDAQQATVLQLPAVSAAHTSPGLEEAGKAAAALESFERAPAPVIALPASTKLSDEEEDRRWNAEQWARYLRLRSQATVSRDDEAWIEWFETTSVCKARLLIEGMTAVSNG